MTTIRELARRSGVSVATVSRAFNTPEVVSQHTRQRILDLAAEIGYLPNGSARTLATTSPGSPRASRCSSPAGSR
ncbi:LacI family DNA-binding transcriptional regulator [Micromonospora tulbaghiae]|uniref:LacI family DNA-binding transcriptional regulator n=1 Tax=Micromonospora tulbaghiae TaxID=479978 RepID=UPI001FD395D4|nr:LacI family DNA-binding transcriptional regulator [Micromonospora tulbaghiae]